MSQNTFSGRPYEELVEDGRRVVATATKSNWELGDLAIEHVGPAGDKDAKGTDVGLKQYAEDIGADYGSLRVYRSVSSAWPEVTRVTSVPWVNYRTIYTDPSRFDIMTTFVMACEETGMKPLYRNFQTHIGKPKTREYTRENAKETAEQALGDLEPQDAAEVIVPVVSQPEVAAEVIKNDEARKATLEAMGNRCRHEANQGDRDRLSDHLDHLMSVEQRMIEMRGILTDIMNMRLREADRAPAAASLRGIAQRAEMVADHIEHPESSTISDDELRDVVMGAWE